jgi:hypothetical protein
MTQPNANLAKSEAEKRAASHRVTAEIINRLIAVGNANGFGEYWVVTMLLTAAGIFSYGMPRADFFKAVKEFMQSTKEAYPEFRYDAALFDNALMAAAIQEREGKTVH